MNYYFNDILSGEHLYEDNLKSLQLYYSPQFTYPTADNWQLEFDSPPPEYHIGYDLFDPAVLNCEEAAAYVDQNTDGYHGLTPGFHEVAQLANEVVCATPTVEHLDLDGCLDRGFSNSISSELSESVECNLKVPVLGLKPSEFTFSFAFPSSISMRLRSPSERNRDSSSETSLPSGKQPRPSVNTTAPKWASQKKSKNNVHSKKSNAKPRKRIRKFFCGLNGCQHAAYNKELLIRHQEKKDHSPDGPKYKCDVCLSPFTRLSSLQRHHRTSPKCEEILMAQNGYTTRKVADDRGERRRVTRSATKSA